MTTDHPQYGLMCEVCFTGLTPDRCAVDTNGDAWDVCAGDCARQAGIVERRLASPTVMDRVTLHFDLYWHRWLSVLSVLALVVLILSVAQIASER